MTYRERREARAKKLREWGEKRIERGAVTVQSVESNGAWSDHAFITQPGHIPGRQRMIDSYDRGCANARRGEAMVSQAEAIEAQTEAAIYDDDPDAIERLKARIVDLEAERERKKAANAAARKAGREQPYSTTNVGARIRDAKARIESLERRAIQGEPWRYYNAAKRGGPCGLCGEDVEGKQIFYRKVSGEVRHYACHCAQK